MPSKATTRESGNILATNFSPTDDVGVLPPLTIGRSLNAMKPGVFATLEKVKPSGALQARKQATGAICFYWRYTIGTKSERVVIGLYDASAPPKSLTASAKGFSVAAAIHAAEKLALEHHLNKADGGRPALLETKRLAAEAAAANADRIGKHTFSNLLDHYADHLQKLERTSHSDVRSIFQLHIKAQWPGVASLPANKVTSDQIVDMMRLVADAGKGRTANKLRSYVRAAYQTARASRSKVSIPVHFQAYEIKHNPAVDTEPDESKNVADKHPLLQAELSKYWKYIEQMDDFKGAVLRLHLLTGAQRIAQLVKLRTVDVQVDQIMLFDGKGRPGKAARLHPLPLIPAAQQALTACTPIGSFAISTDGGKTHLAATTLSKWAKAAAAQVGIADFQAKRLRSGVETLLAKTGLTQEIRGRLQSHGISGVQARHYDGHDYMPEKLKALKKLASVLTYESEASALRLALRPAAAPSAPARQI